MKIKSKKFPRMERDEGINYKWYAEQIECGLKVDKNTKIVSMGSCFAMEIKKHLISSGYNYMQFEKDKDPWAKIYSSDDKRSRADIASCAWERVFHTHGLTAITAYSLEEAKYDRLYRHKYKGKDYWFDLLRTRIAYESKELAEKDIEDHVSCSAEALETCDVLVFTMGLTEVWTYKDMPLACSPEFTRIDGEFKFKSTGYQENLENMIWSVERLKECNPNIKILLTVSPVHMRATYRDDVDVLSATSYSKAVLRAVADTVVKTYSNVYYFPSYEIVTVLANIMGDKAYPDGHHVSEKVISKIMQTFDKVCT